MRTTSGNRSPTGGLVIALPEFRTNWPNLLGTCLGLATGSALSFFTMNMFAPALIADLGWSRADFALLGTVSLLTMPVTPLIGRFIDRVGPRIAGAVGFAAVTLYFLALSMMQGELWQFFAIHIAFGFFGVMTSSMVFGRVIVDRFDRSRGLALSIMMTASPVSGAIAGPLIGAVIDDHGWRAAYMTLALVSAMGGVLTIALIGHGAAKRSARADLKLSRAELMGIARNPVFPLLIAGMFLVNIPQVLAQSQLKLIVMDIGMSNVAATWMVSLYPLGSIAGRLFCGVALDHARTHLVALVTLGVPTISYLLLAAEFNTTWLLIAAILMIGVAQGAEGDVGAYTISRRFDAKNFSLLYACLSVMVSSGSAIGSLVLSLFLRQGDSYVPFSLVCAVATIVGAALFGLTGLVGRHGESAAEKKLSGEIS
jgi:MFS family permease